jgi:FtsP/CotA-like multicopper oxidase with cupredoxin domain
LTLRVTALAFSATALLAGSVAVTAPARQADAAPSEKQSAPVAAASHETAEGFVLAPASRADARPRSAPTRCTRGARVRTYRVAALAVDITLNRYLDHDPRGRMYALERGVTRVRDEERRNEAARADTGEPAVSTGLQGDAIQPLTLRVAQGECLRIRLRNALTGTESASIHLHGGALQVRGRGPALASNAAATARPSEIVDYEWMVPATEPEGTHEFHSHGDVRNQTDHGLFGAVIVEPRRSTWTDPRTGGTATGWDAVVHPPGSRAFREFTLYYHEVGNEAFQVTDAKGEFLPLVDPLTSAYRPSGRALNYRSEPFLHRLQLGQSVTGRVDESLEYSSYAFGDPATPIMRSYLGEPVKERLVHGGGEVFHVHHVHGGGVRWLRQTRVEADRFAVALDKHPPLLTRATDRTDSQAIGPSETFDIANECGSGGCQQSAGDFMYHCHVTHHYFAGMWAIWRVYNTLQVAGASTDTMPPLPALPGLATAPLAGVPSDKLANTDVDWYGENQHIGADVGGWVQAQLPPRGVPHPYDASVWDWTLAGTVAMGEPETAAGWPGYRSATPGARVPVLFDPRTGKPAFPFLRPHLAQRPPFAPGHGPAPFLDGGRGTAKGPAPPGGAGPGSSCPDGARADPIAINAISVPVPVSKHANIVDPKGEIYVLRADADRARADPAHRMPLVLRAAAGRDCVDVVFRNEVPDSPSFSKVGVHIHFVQFDVQGSDGVDTGFNYEQTVRPLATGAVRLRAAAPAGATVLDVDGANAFTPGAAIGVGLERDGGFETVPVGAVNGSRITLGSALQGAHGRGELVGTEFVRYRWYPDAQFGSALFHDHVNVLESGAHGLFGTLISEPPDATWTDPHSGAALTSGVVADIHTATRMSVDVTGSFRELVLLTQDDNPLTHVGRSSGSSFDLRADPPEARSREPAKRFSSANGDPDTPLLEANLGDPIALRTIVGASNDVHSVHLDGHWFRTEPQSRTSPPVNTVHLGISEREDVFVRAAGGPQRQPGDYLYYNGRSFKLREGSWGIVRVHPPGEQSGLQALPGRPPVSPVAAVCPSAAPVKRFAVSAVEVPLPMLGGGKGEIYVLDRDRDAVVANRIPPQPLVLHVNVGDCLRVQLTNLTSGGPVTFHTDLLAADPATSGGVAAGRDPDTSVAPGKAGEFMFFASPEVGPTTAMVRDWGDVLQNPGRGLYGAIVVGPTGTGWTDTGTGSDASATSRVFVDAHPPGEEAYRDVTLFFQDEDALLGTHRMPYNDQVDGTVGINYRNEPFANRLTTNPDPATVMRALIGGDPQTPLLRAFTGDAVRIHVLAPWSEQPQVFAIEGHEWPVEPGRRGTALVSQTQLSGLDVLNLELEGGAGGRAHQPGDFVYGDHREPYRQAGLWGVFRVRARCRLPIRPLTGSCGRHAPPLAADGAVALAIVIVATVIATRRRSRRVRD